jgi:hypothetical protein
MSAQPTLPVEQQFATGHQGESLVLMVCQAGYGPASTPPPRASRS